jgi:hypothetical protein
MVLFYHLRDLVRYREVISHVFGLVWLYSKCSVAQQERLYFLGVVKYIHLMLDLNTMKYRYLHF